MSYETLKIIHFSGMILLLGVGGASAFYKYMIDKTSNVEMIFQMNKLVVLADWLFTTPSIIIQPISGFALINLLGYSIFDSWILFSLILYSFSTFLWLYAVYLQIKMKKIANDSYNLNKHLPELYFRYARIWYLIGFASFFSMLSIIYFMVLKTNF